LCCGLLNQFFNHIFVLFTRFLTMEQLMRGLGQSGLGGMQVLYKNVIVF